jgi:hypothetical protein
MASFTSGKKQEPDQLIHTVLGRENMKKKKEPVRPGLSLDGHAHKLWLITVGSVIGLACHALAGTLHGCGVDVSNFPCKWKLRV